MRWIASLFTGETRTMSHLDDYLAYYQTLTTPGYAVLVTGEWGTGKTFQVRKCLGPADSYYVSLFGLHTVEEIHAEVFAAASPYRAKAARFADRFSKASAEVGDTVGVGGMISASIANAFIKREVRPDRTIIFDDLERSCLLVRELVGAINTYVELRGFRVVVIANDSELADTFVQLKEKTFGQTIRAEPQLSTALEAFQKLLLNRDVVAFVKQHEDEVLATFKSSGVHSLRILKHVLEDIGRLHRGLSDIFLQNADAMRELICVFVALNIEVREGRLDEQALNDRSTVLSNYRSSRLFGGAADGQDAPKLVKVSERYPSLDLGSNILNDDLLKRMLINGKYDDVEIGVAVGNSRHFLVPEETAPWKVIYEFDTLDDAIIDEAIQRMGDQFANRLVDDEEELFHIFALKLMLAEADAPIDNTDPVIDEIKKYIDDLRDHGRLEPRTNTWHGDDLRRQTDGGRGFWTTEGTKPLFKEIHEYFLAQRDNALQDKMPDIVAELLSMVGTDAGGFFESVSVTNNGPNPYARVPLLHNIPVEEFVNAWLGSPPSNWRNTYYALENRYRDGGLARNFAVETDWAIQVHDTLLARAARLNGFRAARIRRVIPNVLSALATKPIPGMEAPVER